MHNMQLPCTIHNWPAQHTTDLHTPVRFARLEFRAARQTSPISASLQHYTVYHSKKNELTCPADVLRPVTYCVDGSHPSCRRSVPCDNIAGTESSAAGEKPSQQYLSDRRTYFSENNAELSVQERLHMGNHAVWVLSDSINLN